MAVSNLILTALATNLFADTVSANAAVSIKASSGTLYAVVVDNSANAATSYAKLYDTAGAVTVGTTAPDWIFRVPASVTMTLVEIGGIAFGAGLQVATVTTGGTAGTTSPTSAVTVSVVYT